MIRQFLMYCFFGGLGVTTDFVLFSSLLYSGVWYQLCNVIGYFAGTLVSFLLNRSITFKVKDQAGRRMTLFFTVAFIGFLSSAAALWLFVDYFSLEAKLSKLLTLPLVVLLQYNLNKRITFNQA